MLTHLKIRNFKPLKEVDFELGQSVVLIGPNNSGKTSALQALALWDIGAKAWLAKYGNKKSPKERPGVTINRRDLLALPIPDGILLWYDRHVRNVARQGGKTQKTTNILIEISVSGITAGKPWVCGLEFDYANAESFYCRPLRTRLDGKERMAFPDEAAQVQVAFLPPLSGLAATEDKLEQGSINRLLGEGRTAEVLRNQCYRIWEQAERSDAWKNLYEDMRRHFGVELLPPVFHPVRGEITMEYRDRRGQQLDISCAGRGFQQLLLLLAHLYANPKSTLLLDEPDAHLEVLRQRQTYNLLVETAGRYESQIIAASHSEIVLNEAAGRDVVIAFVGQPHRIGDRGTQVLKALKDIGFDQYYLAETKGWVLYLEGPTDLAILQVLAKALDHPAARCLEDPFVHYVRNQVGQARHHFFALQEAKPNLVGVALFDRIDDPLHRHPQLPETMWRKRELENYLCQPDVLFRWAKGEEPQTGATLNWLDEQERARSVAAMEEAIEEVSNALAKLRKPSPWSDDIKASDDFLDLVFVEYFEKLGRDNVMRKTNYHRLATLLRPEQIDPEIREKLDLICQVAERAQPEQ